MRRTLFSVLLALCTMPSAFGMVMVSGQFKNHSFNSFLIGELNCSGGTGVKLDNLGNFKYNAYTDVGKEIHLVYGISLDKCTTVKIPSDGNLGVIDAESGTRTPGMKEMVAAARERENQPISGRFIGQKFKSAQISLYSCHESGESFAVNSDGTFSRKITNPSNSTKGYIIYPKVGGGTECVPVTIGSDGDVGEIVVETGGTKQENSSQPANETKQIKICLKYENGNPYKRNDMIYTVEINPVGSSKRYLHSDNADRNGCFTADIPNTEQKVNVKVSRGMTFDNVDVGLRNPVAIPRDGNLGTYTVQSSKEREAANEAKEKSSAEKECAGKSGWEVKKENGKWVCQKTKKQEKADKQADKQAKEDKQAECDKRKMGEVAEKNENGEWVCVSGKDSDEIKAARIECGGKPDPENWTVVKNGLGKWVCKQDKDFTKEQRKQQKECDKAGLAQTAEKHEDGTWFCADTAETEKIQTVQDECKSKPTPDDWVVEQDKSGNWACVQTKNSTKKEEKRAECSEKRMGVEKKGLLWACADDANITSMWDDLDALEKALSDKLIELKTAAANAEQQSPEQGDGEQGTPGEGDGK